MTQSREDQKNRSDAVEIEIEIASDKDQHQNRSQKRLEKDESSGSGCGMREALVQPPNSKRHGPNFLKRFLFTLLLLNLVPNSAVNALALNAIRNGTPPSQPSESALYQFYFRNNTQKEQPVVISSSSDNNSNSDSQVDAEPEPKSNLSHAKANASAASPFSNVNSAENSIPHEHDENDAVKNGSRPQFGNFSSVAPAGSGNRTSGASVVGVGSGSKPACEKKGTSGYKHSVEDILRQIFAADGLDEDEVEEEEDDEEFMNEHYQQQNDRDDRYEFEHSTSTFNGTTATAVLHARHARDIDSRRGPLQIDEADDESAQSSAGDDDEDADAQSQPPRPQPPKPKKTPLAQGNNNNKNRMNPPKNQQQQPQQARQPNQNKRKQQAPKKPVPANAPVNPAEKRAEMLAKYNAYVDAVFSRMNVLIKKKRMDPLRVNLYAGPSKPAGGGGGNGNGNGNGGSSAGSGNAGGVAKKNGKRKAQLGKNKNKRKNSRMEDDSNSDDHDEFGVGPSEEHEEDDDESSGASSADEERGFRSGNGDSSGIRDVHLDSNVFGRSIRSLLANISQYSHAVLSNPGPSSEKRFDDDADDSHGELEAETVEEARGNVNGKAPGSKKNVKNRNGGGLKNKNSDSDTNTSEKFIGKNKNKNKFNKNKNRNAPRPTRGILHGLSSLRRDGNVQVVKDGPKARIVRAKFLLGPVALEILPKKGKPGRGQSRENSDNNVNVSTSRQNPSPAGSAPAGTSSGGNTSADADGGSTDGRESTGTTPAATATAPQLRGILEIRLAPNRPTRIRKLRVFPPGNVQVEGDKATTTAGGKASKTGSGYRKVTPQATARLRQTALQVVRQVDKRLRPAENRSGNRKKPGQRQRIAAEEWN